MSAEPWKQWTAESVRGLCMPEQPVLSEALKAFADLLDTMTATPPAKEPVSVDGTCAGYGLPGANGMLSVVRVLVDVLQDEGEKAGIKRGDRVRVVKIEETT